MNILWQNRVRSFQACVDKKNMNIKRTSNELMLKDIR